MNNNEYIRMSLELHLFFARIMKEHALFIATGFLDVNNDLKNIAKSYQGIFADILENAIRLGNGNVSREVLAANEIVTNNTLAAEQKTSSLTGAYIDTEITSRELNLRSGDTEVTDQLLSSVSYLNRHALPLIQQLIEFKNNILENVLQCTMFTTNYPLLIRHIMNEAKMYYNLINKVENRERITNEYIYQQEVFWNNIMKEHAEFIRGLLDPSEKQLIVTANNYANQYEKILNQQGNNLGNLTAISLKETIDFRNFKVTGEEGILNCKIKSIILPLLADHVVREANHFIRILRSVK